MSDENVTLLLSRWRGGDDDAFDELAPVIYDSLRRLATRHMKTEGREHTLQPTALVNEAFLKLVGMDVDWADRAHFLAVASRQMRRLLVDHARAKRRHKRDGGVRVTLDDALARTGDGDVDLVDVHNAIEELKENDERKAQLVELHYFGGLTYKELAVVTEISEATVHRELRMAKAWLRARLNEGR